MDLTRASLLRDLLTGTELATRTARFAHDLRRYTTTPHGLLLFGPPEDEPWHLTAHIDDELHRAGFDQLRPALVRWSPPVDAPPQLRIGLDRLREVRRGESLLVVTEPAPEPVLLERIDDARRRGATVFSIDNGDRDLAALSHESLVPDLLVPASLGDDWIRTASAIGDRERLADQGAALPPPVAGFETAQHLVSLAVADDNTSPSGWRGRLRTLIERVAGGPDD